jgi:TetR/AcrR family transcriptional repressor of mexJK operon
MESVKKANPEPEVRKRMHGGGARPRAEDKRLEELLDIATDVFVTHGFESASTNEIAKRAGSSKGTFYSRFPTKEKLFIAVLERRMDRIFSLVSEALPLDPPMEETLREYGNRVLKFALSPDQLSLLRVVAMESTRFPELGIRFYELGPKRGQTLVGQYMKEQIKRGNLMDEDPHLMAEHLMSLITGGPVRWLILGLKRSPIANNGQRHVEAAVKAFLRSYALRTAS